MDPDGARSQKRNPATVKGSGKLFKKKGILLFVLFAFQKRKASCYLLFIKQPCIIRLPLLKKMLSVGPLDLFKVTPSYLRNHTGRREEEKQERENLKKWSEKLPFRE